MSKSEKVQNLPQNKMTDFKPQIVKHVTLPLLKQQDGVEIYFAITSLIEESKQVAQKKGETIMEAANVFKLVNLETGEEMEMIANSVLKSTLEENYPDGEYLNKAFAVTRHAKEKGKRYNTYSVTEIVNPLAG
jgi:hypothetical protein